MRITLKMKCLDASYLFTFDSGIGIQGQVFGSNWVTSFRMTYSLDEVTWIPYTRKDFPQQKVNGSFYIERNFMHDVF